MIEKTEDYLMDLLGRSLVMLSKRSDDGQIKACHVHDLLRSLCMWKAMEEGFSPISYRYGRVSSAMYPVPDAEVKNNLLPGMSSEHSTQHIDFVLCCPIELGEWESLHEDFSSGKIIVILENLQTISGAPLAWPVAFAAWQVAFVTWLLGIGQSLGNREQVISSMAMGNLVNGGNIGRSLSSSGLNMPGVAARLNLTSNCGPKDYK
ncbi:hypothetical protein R6Q57_013131 [Mikania cordata]